MAFLGWLTSRQTSVTFGATHDATIAADLWKTFVEANGWSQTFSSDWPNNFQHPIEPFRYPDELADATAQAIPSNIDIVDLHFPDN
jgi:hypothetical protein